MFSFTRHLNAQSGFSNDDVKQRPGQVESIELTQPGGRKMGRFFGGRSFPSRIDFARATKSALTVGALINQHPNKKNKKPELL